MEKTILIIDIETTGFLQKGGKIVEIGITELDLDTGEREIVYDKVVHEFGTTKEEVATSWILQNSSMTLKEVVFSPTLESEHEEIQFILDRYTAGATAYNNKFDFEFMESRNFIFPKKLDCPMLLSTDICKIPSKIGKGYKWPNFEEAYLYFFGETAYIEEHRGGDDSYHEAELVKELYDRGIFKID